MTAAATAAATAATVTTAAAAAAATTVTRTATATAMPRWQQLCYDLGSSLCKRNDLQGKDGLTSVLQNLTKGLAWTDAEDNISRMGTGGSKG